MKRKMGLQIRIQTDWNLKFILQLIQYHIKYNSNLDRLEFKEDYDMTKKMIDDIRIQTDWNLKIIVNERVSIE